ncbi:hypothetical protein [uncultured Winogradskyella sp.]|uniref:hypothetical protein n=1 Tax=uncultured Winogradskyella sp. TaxID=395353 RepID=UPI002610AFE4|nr:hypothetical protein [uncultured Winogradskyella sp.]|tara:strand:+ start:42 stop:557 length:516 start_codon:yes stop_codon:yes gene_type:complete
MNKLKNILLLVLLVSSTIAFSQTKESAIKDATATTKANIDMDFDTVIKHTLPAVLDMMGGKDAALQVLKSTMEGAKAQGLVFEKAEVIKVSELTKEQGQSRCIVEGYTQMTMSGQRVKTKIHYIGIYNDVDKYWWFVEAKQLNNKVLANKILPNFETALEIPEDDVQVEKI